MPVAGLIIVGCSRRKKPYAAPALDLYEGWCIPRLRQAIAPHQRNRVLVMSARHGLLQADEQVDPYDQAMTPERAQRLRPHTFFALAELHRNLRVSEALLLLPELYVAALDASKVAPVVHTVSDPVEEWSRAEAILNYWGWSP